MHNITYLSVHIYKYLSQWAVLMLSPFLSFSSISAGFSAADTLLWVSLYMLNDFFPANFPASFD